MLKIFLYNFNKLPESNKSMIYLMWIYDIWAIISSIFINIYVFKINNSLGDIIYFNIFFLTFSLIGFTYIWFLMSIFKKNIRNMYYVSYILFILAFTFLFFYNWNLIWVYVFWVLFWLWNWAFWCAVHTQELKNIENKNRDFYSSSISVWQNIVSVLVPLLVAFLFYISKIYKFEWYIVLFLGLPMVYIISFFFVKNIDVYIPKKVTKVDIKNFFDLSRYKYGHLYFFFTWFRQSIIWVILSVIWITFLKTEENIWLFQAILTFISTFSIIHLSHKRNEKNRLKYYLLLSLLMMLLYIWFWIYFWLISYLIFSLLLLFVKPIFRISEHVYDLSMMDNIKTKENDFYPAMLFREIILWVWRMSWLLFLLVIYYFSWFELNFILRIWVYLIWFSFIFLYFWAYLWEKYEKNNF